MSRQRSILVLILVPAVVSLAVTLLVLSLWSRQQAPNYITLPTTSGTALIPPRTTQAAEGDVGSQAAGEEVSGEEPGSEGACENPVHSVASGESLSAISELYDISMDDIIAVNTMIDPAFNPNLLSIGQQIVIPVCGVPTPTPAPTMTSTTVPTRIIPAPIPTSTALPPGVVRVQVARVRNPGDVTSEAVEIINEGTSVARLEGWTMVNERSGEEFAFPALNLFPQGAVTLHTGAGEDTAIDIYWGRDAAVWEIGDIVQLLDADGELQAEYEIADE